MHNIKTTFVKIHEILQAILVEEVNEKGKYSRRGTVPKMSDIAVMALSLTAECLSIDSENYLFLKLNTDYRYEFANLISRRQYNERRKLLFEKIEQARKLWQQGLTLSQIYLPLIPCRWRFANAAGRKEIKWEKNPIITSPIKATLLRRKSIFMDTSCTAFVRQWG